MSSTEATAPDKQVLLVNVTRMGDLIQMIPLLRRLEHEWPGVGIDLVIDVEFAPVASLLPGLRRVVTYDFQRLMDESRARVRDVVSLYREVAEWAEPLARAGYDRVINLTFNARSAYLTGYVGVQDTRGLTTAPDGSLIVRNPWMQYFADLHAYRRFNRFNIVDVCAMGGSGPGPFAPIRLTVDAEAEAWAIDFLRAHGNPARWVAVQVGASDPMKAWRPEYFGRTMALLSRRANLGFVLIGSQKEAAVAREALTVFRVANGTATLCPALGKTTVPRLVGILSRCALMLTNDTGPMHLAVGVGLPVVALSVGHVDVWETGPYGSDHWVVQPDIACGPCGFDQICPHQACKDHLLPEQVAALCLHALKLGSFPDEWPRARVYESGVDRDGLGTFRIRAGSESPLSHWYGRFWRQYWFEVLNGRPGAEPVPDGPPPDYSDARDLYRNLCARQEVLERTAEELTRASRLTPLPAARIKQLQARVTALVHEIRMTTLGSPAFAPVTTALARELHNFSSVGLAAMTDEQWRAIERWRSRVREVWRRLHLHASSERNKAYACTA